MLLVVVWLPALGSALFAPSFFFVRLGLRPTAIARAGSSAVLADQMTRYRWTPQAPPPVAGLQITVHLERSTTPLLLPSTPWGISIAPAQMLVVVRHRLPTLTAQPSAFTHVEVWQH